AQISPPAGVGNVKMRIAELSTRMALSEDLPEPGLRRGDVATLVEHHPGRPGQEDGYSLEVFNAVGDTVAVVTVRESQLAPLTADELLSVRPARWDGTLKAG
ncbi:MAG: DUF4926 domain-containing protein, partial [Verrucomicrobiota bacterium]